MTPVAFMALFEEFRAPSWDGWRRILARLTPGVREFWASSAAAAASPGSWRCSPAATPRASIGGRRASRSTSASSRPDRKQAGITFRYILGLLRSVPELAALIVAETRDSVELANGVVIEVITASTAAPRGRAYALAIIEEAAFLPADQSANPDTELLRALRPALARVPGSLLAVVSSPYARRGELFRAFQRHHAALADLA